MCGIKICLLINYPNFKGIVLSLVVNKDLNKVRFSFVEILYKVDIASSSIFHILRLLFFSTNSNISTLFASLKGNLVTIKTRPYLLMKAADIFTLKICIMTLRKRCRKIC